MLSFRPFGIAYKPWPSLSRPQLVLLVQLNRSNVLHSSLRKAGCHSNREPTSSALSKVVTDQSAFNGVIVSHLLDEIIISGFPQEGLKGSKPDALTSEGPFYPDHDSIQTLVSCKDPASHWEDRER